MGIVADFEAMMATFDDAVASAAQAEAVIRSVGEMRGVLQVAESRAVAVLDRHAAEGVSVSAEEVLTATGMSGRRARDAAGRARTHHDLALAGDADEPTQSPASPVAMPAINPENVAAISRASASLQLPEEQERFAARRAELSELAQQLDPTVFAVRLKAIVNSIRASVATSTVERHRNRSRASSWINADGMRVINAELDRVRGDAIWTAVEREMRSLAASADASDGEPLAFGPQLAAEALFQVAERAFDPGSKTSRPLIGVLVDAETLAHGRHDDTVAEHMGEPGSVVSDESLRRYLCDADLQSVVMTDGEPLAVGRRHRTATISQRLALRAVYDTCAFPGCDSPFDWCHVHHLDWWEHGGQTDLDNLVPLCSRHHHLAHEGRWEMKLLPGRVLETWRPDGTPYAVAAPHGPVDRWRPPDREGDLVHHREPSHN